MTTTKLESRTGGLAVLTSKDLDRREATGLLPPTVLADTAMLHVSYTADPPCLHVIGEVDLSNLDMFAECLDTAIRAGSGDLSLDLALLSFISVGGLRSCLRAARTLNDRQRQLIVRALDRSSRKVLALLDDERLLASGEPTRFQHWEGAAGDQ